MLPLGRFPFGRPVTSCKPSANGPRRLVVLGAYPSALHVRWTPPPPFRRIVALAVENEPTPFWTGDDEERRVEEWKVSVGWEARWGSIAPVGNLNGPSGSWVAESVLGPLGARPDEAWITDCLDTYRVSVGAAARLMDTYRPFAAAHGLPEDNLQPHPSENAIVTEALADHRSRLTSELATARASLVVTLGNAALRVLAGIGEVGGVGPPRKLALDRYGTTYRLRVGENEMEWLPLAHPAAPKIYQEAHAAWCRDSARANPHT
jgi:hypothetical protein